MTPVEEHTQDEESQTSSDEDGETRQITVNLEDVLVRQVGHLANRNEILIARREDNDHEIRANAEQIRLLVVTYMEIADLSPVSPEDEDIDD